MAPKSNIPVCISLVPQTMTNVSASSLGVTPAGVAKALLSINKPTGQTLSVSQISQFNRTSSSTPIVIKTTRAAGEGSNPTYVAISIPPHSSSSAARGQNIPLTIHQLKVKQQTLTGGAGSSLQDKKVITVPAGNLSLLGSGLKTSLASSQSNVVIHKVGGYSSATADHSSYGSSSSVSHSSTAQHSSAAQAISSNFPYNDSSMYSQSSVASYMDGGHSGHHSNSMYPYHTQPHQSTLGVGVSPQAIGVAQQAQYLQPGQAANQRVPISHTTRASPMTVQWLLENFDMADGVSLPRHTLYTHYLRHCAENKIDAVNAASFGKLIRSVFLGLKTRRLGTRGNSKYHYYGIRVKANSPLARLTDDTQVALRAQPSTSKRSMQSTVYGDSHSSASRAGDSQLSAANIDSHEGAQGSSHSQYLGNSSDGLTDMPVLDMSLPLPEDISEQMMSTFATLYRHHCEAILEVVSNLKFELVESLWQAFWRSPAAANKPGCGTYHPNDVQFETGRLVLMCKFTPVQTFVKEADYALYQKLTDVLVPDVLRAVPSSLTQAVRNFAKSLENLLIGSMSEMPKEIVNIKVASVSAFSQTLRRYTSLNHLAQAARAVLQNPQQINQMWTDLNKVDFSNVQEQSSWVCQCDESLIQKLEQDFKHTLGQQQSLEQWAQWLENVVATVLEEHQGRDSYPKAARQFLLNWSFYSSMIIRDLTLRSAASFGSFHLIRLLYDEYMFYLIEHKVAAHCGKSPLAVMAECVGLMAQGGSFSNGSLLDDDDEHDDSSNDEASLSETPQPQSVAMLHAAQQDPIMSQPIAEPELKRIKLEYSLQQPQPE